MTNVVNSGFYYPQPCVHNCARAHYIWDENYRPGRKSRDLSSKSLVPQIELHAGQLYINKFVFRTKDFFNLILVFNSPVDSTNLGLFESAGLRIVVQMKKDNTTIENINKAASAIQQKAIHNICDIFNSINNPAFSVPQGVVGIISEYIDYTLEVASRTVLQIIYKTMEIAQEKKSVTKGLQNSLFSSVLHIESHSASEIYLSEGRLAINDNNTYNDKNEKLFFRNIIEHDQGFAEYREKKPLDAIDEQIKDEVIASKH